MIMDRHIFDFLLLEIKVAHVQSKILVNPHVAATKHDTNHPKLHMDVSKNMGKRPKSSIKK